MMRNCRAFTLIELVAAIVVIGILAAAGAPTLVASVQAYNATLNEVATLDQLRYASERMAREFREVNWNGSQFQITSSLSNASSTPTSASFTRIEYPGTGTSSGSTYTVGLSRDTQDSSQLNLSYTLSGTTYTNVLARNVSALTFTYYDSTGTVNPTVSTVRYVDILLTLTANGQSYSQNTRVALRNH